MCKSSAAAIFLLVVSRACHNDFPSLILTVVGVTSQHAGSAKTLKLAVMNRSFRVGYPGRFSNTAFATGNAENTGERCCESFMDLSRHY
jgi:hypothetical protein